MKGFTIVVAVAGKDRAIGKCGELPWRISKDLKHFKDITCATSCVDKNNAVIMGRKTWESIPDKFKPLANRVNVVLSSTALDLPEGVILSSSLDTAMDRLNAIESVDKVFIIGGQNLYEEALGSVHCEKIVLTAIENHIPDCDAFFPVIPADRYRMVSRSNLEEEGEYKFKFVYYEAIPDEFALPLPPPMVTLDIFNMTMEQLNKYYKSNGNVEEAQYLVAIHDILRNGSTRGDRTGVGTISKFGMQMRYNLREEFPLLTTKRVFWRGLAEELLWFIKGTTNANELAAKDIHIWDGNGSREFLDNLGFTDREVGDLGPVYGFQWRHFGAEYTDMHSDYANKGIDQLLECVEKIKNKPTDRRILMTAWNVSDLKKMALPPCHMFCQFYVNEGELSCQMYQRSADMGLGVPFNIASYALLTRMMAQVCGLKAGEFIHTMGDAHVYSNHVDALKEQLKRIPRPFPTLSINPDKTDIDGFEYSDFTVNDYKPYPTIKMQMAV